jgi:hypothetical protein
MQIFLDFDGTVVEHFYPLIGAPNPGCEAVISSIQKKGYEIVLNTYRVEIEDNSLQEAIAYLNQLDLFQKIRLKTNKKVHPQPWDVKKAFESGILYLDDIAEGIPLIDAPVSKGKMVDWEEVGRQLKFPFLQ